MGDRLEDFFRENRSEFDSEEPAHDLWDRIDQDLKPGKNHRSVYWKVAAVIFLVATVALLADKYTFTSPVEVNSELAEFQEAENFYASLIQERKIQIDHYENQGNIHREFLDDMKELDDLYIELRDTYDKTNGNQKMMDALISNLRLRMHILDRQIEILERLNDFEDENEEPASA